MKFKALLIVILLISVFCVSGTVLALTEQETQTIIAQLQAQIDSLLQQINQLIAQQQTLTTTPQNWCYTFNTNLGFANSGTSDVGQLHTALTKQGISFSPDTGNIYSYATARAVSVFQERYASEILTPIGETIGTGFFGTATRTKLNQLYGCTDQTYDTEDGIIVCTQDARQCADGSWVSRVPPSCNFAPCPTAQTCTVNNWIYNLSPETCPTSGQQTKIWTKIGTCTGGVSKPAYEIVSCSYQSNACTSFDYSDWSACFSSGIQTRTVTSSYPLGCTGGNPVTSQACTYTETPQTCTEGNWTFDLSPETCPASGQQTKIWTKIGTCTGGVSKPNSEIVNCSLAPRVDIKANGLDGPLTVGSNSSAVLTWSSENATSCTASGAWSGQKQINGTQTTSLISSAKTYTITCTGPGGTTSDSVILSSTSATMVSIKANNTSSSLSVDSYTPVKLTWSSENATSCTASGAWSGSRFVFGEESLPRYQSTTGFAEERIYTITCTGPSGTATDAVTVNVSAGPVKPTVKIKINNLEQHLILTKEDFFPWQSSDSKSFNLSWSSTNASYCSVSTRDSMGNRPPLFSQGWSGSKPLIGVETKTIKSGYNLPWWTTYGIECGGPGGKATDSITVYHFFQDHLKSSKLVETRPQFSPCTHEMVWWSVPSATFEIRAYPLDVELNKIDIFSLSLKDGPILPFTSLRAYGKDERVFIGSVLFDRVNKMMNAHYIGVYVYIPADRDPKMPKTEILLDKFYHQAKFLSSFPSAGLEKSCYERSQYPVGPTLEKPNWECENWGSCIDGKQTRKCTMTNVSYVNVDRPSITRSCTLGNVTPLECVPNWECENWGSCIDGKQTRKCKDLNNCSCSISNAYNCAIISGRPHMVQDCSLSCKITDIYSETNTGSYKYIFIKANNLPAESNYEIIGDTISSNSKYSWNGTILNVVERNSDGSTLLRSISRMDSDKVWHILDSKSKVIIGKTYLNNTSHAIEYIPICDYQKTVSLTPVYPQSQLASLADIVSKIAQQIKNILK